MISPPGTPGEPRAASSLHTRGGEPALSGRGRGSAGPEVTQACASLRSWSLRSHICKVGKATCLRGAPEDARACGQS